MKEQIHILKISEWLKKHKLVQTLIEKVKEFRLLTEEETTEDEVKRLEGVAQGVSIEKIIQAIERFEKRVKKKKESAEKDRLFYERRKIALEKYIKKDEEYLRGK